MTAAPVPPEAVVENVAQALWTEAQATAFMTVDPTERSREERFRRLAAAAIGALPPSPAAEAAPAPVPDPRFRDQLAEALRQADPYVFGPARLADALLPVIAAEVEAQVQAAANQRDAEAGS